MSDEKVAINDHCYAVVYDLPLVGGEEKYSVVCTSWLFKKNSIDCIKYPSMQKLNKYLKSMKDPEQSWSEHEVFIVATYKTLEKANKKVKKLIDFNENTTTDNDEHVLRKTKQRKNKGVNNKYLSDYNSSDSLDEDQYFLDPLPVLKLKDTNKKVQDEFNVNIDDSILDESLQIATSDPSIVSDSVINEKPDGEHDNIPIIIDEGYFDRPTSSNSFEGQSSGQNYNTSLGVTILKKLISIEQRQKSMENQLAEFIKFQKTNSYINNSDINLPKLPIDSMEELDKLEDDLQNAETSKALVNQLKRSNGINEKDCVNKILPKVFGFYLGRACSLKGKCQNRKLEGTKILLTIHEAVLENYPHMKNETFHNAITDWFRGGQLRYTRNMKKN